MSYRNENHKKVGNFPLYKFSICNSSLKCIVYAEISEKRSSTTKYVSIGFQRDLVVKIDIEINN